MQLSNTATPVPEEARAEISHQAKMGATTGQRILAWIVALCGAAIIVGGVSYKVLSPMMGDKTEDSAKKSEAKKAGVVVESPSLNLGVPLDGGAPEPQTEIGTNKGIGKQIAYKPCPPGMTVCDQYVGSDAQGNGSMGSANQGQVQGQGQQVNPAIAEAAQRKMKGSLGNFDDDEYSTQTTHGPNNSTSTQTQQQNQFQTNAGQNGVQSTPSNAGANNGLSAQLVATATPATSASYIANPHLTLKKGTPITCVMDSALMTDQAGFGQCITDFPVYSMDGKVVLAERGTLLEYEYAKSLELGKKAIFVLFTRGVTPAPHNVTFNLNSPGTDQLGRAGISGEIDNKFWDRFSGALMFSILQDGIGIAANRGGQGGNTNVVLMPNTQNTGQGAVGEVLKQGSEIKPALSKNHGSLIGITVARDIDFSSVYKLRGRKNNE